MIKKGGEKALKCNDLAVEMQRWNVKTKAIEITRGQVEKSDNRTVTNMLLDYFRCPTSLKQCVSKLGCFRRQA